MATTFVTKFILRAAVHGGQVSWPTCPGAALQELRTGLLEQPDFGPDSERFVTVLFGLLIPRTAAFCSSPAPVTRRRSSCAPPASSGRCCSPSRPSASSSAPPWSPTRRRPRSCARRRRRAVHGRHRRAARRRRRLLRGRDGGRARRLPRPPAARRRPRLCGRPRRFRRGRPPTTWRSCVSGSGVTWSKLVAIAPIRAVDMAQRRRRQGCAARTSSGQDGFIREVVWLAVIVAVIAVVCSTRWRSSTPTSRRATTRPRPPRGADRVRPDGERGAAKLAADQYLSKANNELVAFKAARPRTGRSVQVTARAHADTYAFKSSLIRLKDWVNACPTRRARAPRSRGRARRSARARQCRRAHRLARSWRRGPAARSPPRARGRRRPTPPTGAGTRSWRSCRGSC